MSPAPALLALLALACSEPGPAKSAPLATSGTGDTSFTPPTSVETADTGETGDTGPVVDTEETGDTDETGAETAPLTEPPPWPVYSEGTCPKLVGGPTKDSGVNGAFATGGATRQFRLLVPDSYDGTVPYPLVIGWHWLGASSSSFVDDGELESAIEQMGFIAAFPDSSEEFLFDWPFVETWAAGAEVTFFEDMLACVSEQYAIDPYHVHGIGVSAGALWLTYLSTLEQVEHFASITSLSGGLADVYGVWQMEWVPQSKKFPAFVLDGGPTDWLGVNFYEASLAYRDALLADGHFVVYCEHDQGHAMPPMTPPVKGSTTFYALWQFMIDHPYDLGPGDSPYVETGLPDFYPEWCAIGA